MSTNQLKSKREKISFLTEFYRSRYLMNFPLRQSIKIALLIPYDENIKDDIFSKASELIDWNQNYFETRSEKSLNVKPLDLCLTRKDYFNKYNK